MFCTQMILSVESGALHVACLSCRVLTIRVNLCDAGYFPSPRWLHAAADWLHANIVPIYIPCSCGNSTPTDMPRPVAELLSGSLPAASLCALFHLNEPSQAACEQHKQSLQRHTAFKHARNQHTLGEEPQRAGAMRSWLLQLGNSDLEHNV